MVKCSTTGPRPNAGTKVSAPTRITVPISNQMIPVLALAGSMAGKKRISASIGTMATHTPMFIWLLIGTVILVGALTFVPALGLGPVVEHLTMIGAH